MCDNISNYMRIYPEYHKLAVGYILWLFVEPPHLATGLLMLFEVQLTCTLHNKLGYFSLC